MSSVDTSKSDAKAPSIKSSLRDKLAVNGMIEGVHYIITDIHIDSPLLNSENPPIVGESISIHYDFSPYHSGYFSYEHLCLFIGRLNKTGRNYVKYFKNVQELHDAIGSFSFKLDTEFAWKQIHRMQCEIEDLMINYRL